MHVVNMYSSCANVILLRHRINKTPSLALIYMTEKYLCLFTSVQGGHTNNSRGASRQSLAFRNSKAIVECYI